MNLGSSKIQNFLLVSGEELLKNFLLHTMKNIAIIGATSDIAKAYIREELESGDSIFLAARSEEDLRAIASDCQVRGAREVTLCLFDAASLESITKLSNKIKDTFEKLDIILIAHGVLPNEEEARTDVNEFVKAYEVNFLSSALLCNELKSLFITSQTKVGVITSVAGDRGRVSNYVYGSAKAGLNAYLSGLRQELSKQNVQILTIKPGFVSTKMTAHLKQGILFASPQKIARDIKRSFDKNNDVLYTPWFWRWILLIIKHVPEFIFKKLTL